MYTKADSTAVALARKCLEAGGRPLELLLIYQFEDDAEAHDDDLQERIEMEFEKEWKRATTEIAREFGAATIVVDYEDTRYVPLNGVGGASSWLIGNKRLYVSYAHEDRELPYYLVVGVIYVIGYLYAGSQNLSTFMIAAFQQGLKEAGYVENQNLWTEYRWAEGHNDRLPALAADLVQRGVAVIVTSGTPAAVAAKAATSTIPVLFNIGVDPVNAGFVASLNRPGCNVTGIHLLLVTLAAKRLEMLHHVIPAGAAMALLVNPVNPLTEREISTVQVAARLVGRQLHVLKASNEHEIEAEFVTLNQEHTGGLVVSSDAYFTARRDRLVSLANRHSVAAVYPWPEYAKAGGLLSYGTSLADGYRQLGLYAGRILKGEKPAELPVQQSVKVELIINLKIAKTLGITFPLTLLGRADEVIE
jgi:ABC-type uncharacterized transport system substrate-binding protein